MKLPKAMPVLFLALALVATTGGRAHSQTVDPNIGARIEQTVPSASERLLYELRENPPRSAALAKTPPRHRSSRPHHGNTRDQTR